jgi:ferredoxin--NADP+ reductase
MFGDARLYGQPRTGARSPPENAVNRWGSLESAGYWGHGENFEEPKALTGWVQGEVREIRRWTERLFSLRIDAQVEPFLAGQYNRLRLWIDGEWVARPYSYVNAPDVRPLEFYLVTVPDGPLTNRLVQLHPGDSVELMPRASGLFTLENVPDARDLWLVSTGTGLGPFLSILRSGECWDRFETVRLVHGVRHVEDLSYRDTLLELAGERADRFRYLPLVSREEAPDALRGRITDALMDGRLERAAGVEITTDSAQVMLCGNPEMVRDLQAQLRERGLQRCRRGHPGQITVENYW